MGVGGSKDTKAKGATPAVLPTLPGWTGPPPTPVKIPLRTLVPEVYALAAAHTAGGAANTGVAAELPKPELVAAAQAVFCQQLRSHGYAVIQLDDPVRSQLLAYRDAAAEFLRKPYEQKQRFAPRQDDPLLRELGSVPNEGYVFTPKLNKEYIKLKASMPADRFADAEMKAKFDALHTSLHAISKKCWSSVCTFKDTSAGMTGPFIAPDVMEQSQAWADVRSSISVIRYWKLQDRDSYLPTPEQLEAVKKFEAERIAAATAASTAKASANSKTEPAAAGVAAATNAATATAAATPAAGDAKAPADTVGDGKTDAKAAATNTPAAATVTAAATASATTAAAPKAELPSAPKDDKFDESMHVPCGVHTDTGMLTYIVCAPVAGLQIQNRFPTKKPAAAKPAATTSNADAKAGATAAGKASEKDEYDEEKTDVTEWMDVEKSHEIGTDLFVIAGRKCSLFAHDKHREKYFSPTIHRVQLPDSTERYSILYFQDCQK